MDALLTTREAAEMLRVSPKTVWAWIRRGLLPAVRVGRLWRVRASDLEAFVERRGWMDADLTHLPPYEWEGEIPPMRPVRYIPGRGFIVED